MALPGVFKGFLKRMYARLLFKGLEASAARVICVSRFTASELLRFCPGLRGRVVVIRNGVDPSWTLISRSRRGAAVSTRYLLTVGNVKPHKNLAMLLEGFTLTSETHTWKLAVVGQVNGFRTGESPYWLEMAQQSERVSFHGRVSDAALGELYANAEALVFPSIYEGFGLPILEAMACGCPVIASNIPAFLEVAGATEFEPDGDGCAIYFDPKDPTSIGSAIERFRRLSPEHVRQMTDNASARVARFSWEDAARKTEAVLREAAHFEVI